MRVEMRVTNISNFTLLLLTMIRSVVKSLQLSGGVAIPKARTTTHIHRTFSTRRSNIIMMPEGPEVRTLVDQLQPAVGQRLIDLKFLSGRYVQHGRPKGFEEFAKTMTPLEKTEEDTDIIKVLNCKGKFIYLILDDGITQSTDDNIDYQRSIWITLGMTGQFINEKDIEKPKPIASNSDRPKSGPRWYFELVDPTTKERRKIYYRDTRNFGTLRFSLSKAEFDEKLSKLGPDMMDIEHTTEEVFLAAMDKSTQTRNICVFLMDQTKIAGVGNYILAEGLYRARLDPFAALSEISTGQRQRLFKELREVITTSYKAQGLTRPEGGTYRTVDGTKGQFEVSLICNYQEQSIVGQQSAHIMCKYHMLTTCLMLISFQTSHCSSNFNAMDRS